MTIIVQDDNPTIVINEVSNPVTIASPGPQGPVGPQGPAGGVNYIHDQQTPSALWVVSHTLNRFTPVTVTDGTGRVIHPTIDYVDANTIHVSHSTPQTGKVYT